MDFFKKLKIRTQLSLAFGLLIGLIFVLACFAVAKMGSTSAAFKHQNEVQSAKLEPLYAAREAFAETGLAARNTFIFTEKAQANRELALVDQEKAIYLAAVEKMPFSFANNPDVNKLRANLLTLAHGKYCQMMDATNFRM